MSAPPIKPLPLRFTSQNVTKVPIRPESAKVKTSDELVVKLSCKLAEARAHPLLSLRPQKNERYDHFYNGGGVDKLTTLLTGSNKEAHLESMVSLNTSSEAVEKKNVDEVDRLEAARARAAFIAFHREGSSLRNRTPGKG